MTFNSIRAHIGSLLLCLLPGMNALSADNPGWPNWRGPNSNGSVETGSYPSKWNVEDAAWKVALPGKGSSTPVVWDNTILVTAPSEGHNAILAFDMDGKKLWETRIGTLSPPKHRTLGSSCNASPVTDGTGIFVYFKSGDFAAIEMDGTPRWHLNLNEAFGAEELYWDQGASPVLAGKSVILPRLHAGDSMVGGFHKESGFATWVHGRKIKAPAENDNGYTTPAKFTHKIGDAVLIWGSDVLSAIRTEDGSEIWQCSNFNPEGTGYWPAIASPTVVGDIAILPVGRDDRPNQASLFGIRTTGNENVTETNHIWKRDDVGVFVATPAVYKNHVYLLRHRGEIVCIDPTNGKTVWSEALPRTANAYYASPVIANGILYAAREDGTVFTAKIEGGFEFIAENKMGERIIASPVPIDGRILLRTDEHLYCIKKQE